MADVLDNTGAYGAHSDAPSGTAATSGAVPVERAGAAERRAKRAFPHPLTILLAVTLLVWVAALFIPSGQYAVDDEGYPIAGSFEQIESPLTFSERLSDLLLAPVNGLYGVEDEEGQVGPFNSGDMFGAIQVFVFILAIGGFMTVLYSMEGLVEGTSSVIFVTMLPIVTLPLAFLVGAASAGNALVMPILAPLGDFAGVDRALVVTAFNAIGSWIGNVLPTNAILMAGLGVASVGFNQYLRFMFPLMGIWLAIQLGVFVIGAI